MTKWFARVVFCVGCCAVARALISAPVNAQQPQQPAFAARVDLIRLDVSVVDKNDQPVLDLTTSDFVLTENGEPQTIRSFAHVQLPGQSATDAPWTRDVAPDVNSTSDVETERVVIILMDELGTFLDLWAIRAAKEIGRQVVDKLGPNDLAAVIFTQDRKKSQELTRDRTRLKAAVARFNSGFDERDTPKQVSFAMTLHTIRELSNLLAEVPNRRKAIIYVGAGDHRVTQITADPELAYLWSRALDAARAANVNIYPVDPTGIEVNLKPIDADVMTRRHDFLRATADNTGGHAFVQTNEFASRVTQIFRETGSFYLLGYVSTHTRADGNYRRISVKTTRPGLTVTTRAGYWGDPPPSRVIPAMPPPPNLVALAGLLPARDIPLRVAAAPFGTPGGAAVAVSLGLPRAQATAVETVDILVKAFTFDGKLRQTVSMRSKLRPGGEDAHLLARLDLPAGRYQLRVAATSVEQKKSGSVYIDLDVPDFSRSPLSVSGIALASTMVSPSSPDPTLATILPVAPISTRAFSTQDVVSAFLRVYQGGTKPLQSVTLSTSIVDTSDAPVFQATETIGPDQFASGRSTDHRFKVPLVRLVRGNYLLRFDASFAGGQHESRTMRFSVQ